MTKSFKLFIISILLVVFSCKKSEENLKTEQCMGQFAVQSDHQFMLGDSIKFYSPTAFTPNADGINDIFTVYVEKAELVALRIKRNGQLIQNLSGSPLEWTGKDQNGNYLESGSFSFEGEVMTSVQDTIAFSGSSTLLRGLYQIEDCSACHYPDQYKAGEGAVYPTNEVNRCR